MPERQQGGSEALKRRCHGGPGGLYRNESVQRYLRQLVEEHAELSGKLQRAQLSEADRRLLVRRHAELLPVANVSERVDEALEELEEVLSLLHSESEHENMEVTR